MSHLTIQVENLSKSYRLGRRERYLALRDVLTNALTAPLRLLQRGPAAELIWALRDVNLEVHQGEILGIVGRNGAGKSTLLKVLTRITKPTSGRARIWGRVGSLLEVGTGFHPELTGRENIFLSGSILGMRKSESRGKMNKVSQGGRTVVLVSHQMNQIRRLCDSVLWMDNGEIRCKGPTAEVV